jgi:hypothetical protein
MTYAPSTSSVISEQIASTTIPPGMWYTNNVAPNTVGSVTIVNGVLETRESTPGGNDNDYGYATAQRGTFPWGSTVGTPLPAGLSTVTIAATLLNDRVLLSGSRYHIYLGLYYTCSGGIDGWFDTQARIQNINGVDTPVGETEFYSPGDSSGWDIVVATLAPGATWNLVDYSIENHFIEAANALGVDPTTPHSLQGIEVGTEGYLIQEVDVNWTNVAFNDVPTL